MAPRDTRDAAAGGGGFLDALVFIGFVALGAFYILIAKTAGVPAVFVTFVPVAVMIAYAVVTRLARALLLRDDQTGDNLYYMGFLFTLTSLGVSLWQFSVAGAAEEIVRNFGVAIATTIAGIALRLFMNQMRRDPVEIERVSRLELADAARRVRRELDSTVVEMNHFRRSVRQSAEEGTADIRALGEQAAALGTALEAAARRIAEAPEPRTAVPRTPLAGSRPEPAPARPESFDRVLERMERMLGAHAAAMDRLTETLSAAAPPPPPGPASAPDPVVAGTPPAAPATPVHLEETRP